jgi:predicted Rossmann fold flavoprotein
MHDLIILGGGAAGLWAAGIAGNRGLKVLVLEKNRKPGVKILMSGGTRCNITQNCGSDDIITAFGKQGRFLKHAIYQLPPAAIVKRLNSLGLATKVESTGKVFPVSDRAIDVRDALLTQLETHGVRMMSGVSVVDLRQLDQQATRWEVITQDRVLPCRSVLLCTGGLSYPGCGTTGDGYRWAQQQGHTIVPTYPALAPLTSPAGWVHELTGITLPDVRVRLDLGSSAKVEKDPRLINRSAFLWTHFGCSGPAPMNVSRYVHGQMELRATNPAIPAPCLRLDLVPDLSIDQLQSSFDASKQGKKRVASILADWLPKKMVALFMQNAAIDDSTNLAELPKKPRQRLIDDLKGLSVPVDGTRGYAKAEVTTGGVNTDQVHCQTLESKLAPGLFLAGEILDIDGPIGGYNFQAAFATAHAAALSVPITP